MEYMDSNELIKICANYSGVGYYVEEMIPADKLANARAKLKIPAGEHVIAFVDATVLGNGKYGLAVGRSGVYWKNNWFTQTDFNFLNWEAFSKIDIQKKGIDDIGLGSGNVFSMASSSFKRHALVRLLQEIQNYIVNTVIEGNAGIPKASRQQAPTQISEWMVAVAGQQLGPYDIHLLKELVSTGQIHPKNSYVWKPGMSSWVPFIHQPEMASLIIRDMSSPPPLPPASLTSSMSLKHVDVNTASYEELVEILGIGAIGAKQIIQYRENIGGFQSPEQVGQLLGLKPHHVVKLSKRVVFTPLPSKPATTRMVDY